MKKYYHLLNEKDDITTIKSVCSCENAISLFTAKFLLQKYVYVQISVGYAQLQNFTFQGLNLKPKNTVQCTCIMSKTEFLFMELNNF
jgi:hypothetical protein